jgi:serine/threonine protein kinase
MSDHPTRTVPTDKSAATPPTGDSTGLDPNLPASPATAPVPPPGYEFADEIGRGGMGVVYRARDTRLSRDVAVKVLQDRYAPGSPAARRFVEEARITGQLQHPGIPPVHEVGALADGRPFLAMKLIKGRTLADQLADGQAERGALIAAFEQVCQAVAYAHNHGVIHRDLKPSNVMVGAFGEVQVMGWGVAKFRTDARVESVEATTATTLHDPRGEWDTDVRTRTGSFLGTPAYMSPEQAIGAIDQFDARSDVFGLGGILCAILTGQPPYVAADAESTRQLAARARLEDAFTRLEGCGAEPELEALCRRCLSPEKSDRPRTPGRWRRRRPCERRPTSGRGRRNWTGRGPRPRPESSASAGGCNSHWRRRSGCCWPAAGRSPGGRIGRRTPVGSN